MLGSHRIHFALALATTVAVGCGNGESTDGSGGQGGSPTTSSSSTGGSSTGGSSTGGSSTGGAGGGLTCETGEGPVLAVSKLAFGDGSSSEWKGIGFNIDGLASTALSKDVCKPNADASTSTPYPDGDEGIDNSFGKNLLSLILSLYPTWVTDINNGIQKGTFTTLLKLECLPPTGDVPSFTAKLFGATNLGSTPKFDGTDKWPVTPELLSDPMDPESSTVVFGQSSVIGSTYDSGKNETFILTVPLKTQTASTSIKLALYAARTTMTLAADRKSATKGTIGGVLNTEEIVAEIKKVGALLGLCGTQAFDNILQEVRQASDIMSDGTQDPEKTCDGISMGLNFEMKEALLGGVGPATPVGMACE